MKKQFALPLAILALGMLSACSVEPETEFFNRVIAVSEPMENALGVTILGGMATNGTYDPATDQTIEFDWTEDRAEGHLREDFMAVVKKGGATPTCTTAADVEVCRAVDVYHSRLNSSPANFKITLDATWTSVSQDKGTTVYRYESEKRIVHN